MRQPGGWLIILHSLAKIIREVWYLCADRQIHDDSIQETIIDETWCVHIDSNCQQYGGDLNG